MNLLEYEAKAILRRFKIPVPSGQTLDTETISVEYPLVLKSQVPVGGRGKLGGIRIVRSDKELRVMRKELIKLEIKEFKPTHILAEELLDIERELYLSLVVNRQKGLIELIASQGGGIEVESLGMSSFFIRPIKKDTVDTVGQELADFYQLETKVFLLIDLLQRLYRCFVQNDALLIEINPLAVTTSGNLIAADCKMTLDSAAKFRHPEWSFENKEVDSNFITLNPSGNIGTIANGAGLAMATVDAIATRGLKPANFLDIGGGATVEGITRSFNRLVEYSDLTIIVINIFGGIVRCDTVAEAIITAKRQIPALPELRIRLSGTNSEQAREILQGAGLALYPTLEACLEDLK